MDPFQGMSECLNIILHHYYIVLPMGPFQGMSETASAAEAPLMLSISGSWWRSRASMLQIT